MHFITLDIAVTWVTTRDRMLDAADKLTVVSTLLLTMITITSDGNVGDAFDSDNEGFGAVKDSVYTCTAFVAMFLFMMST